MNKQFTKQFTKQFMEQNCGCYSKEKLYDCSFMQKCIVLLSDIISSEISLKDKFWFVCKKCATLKDNQQLAISIAEIVLPIYESKYQNNKVPRNAIEAAKKYIKGEININELFISQNAVTASAYAATASAYADAATASTYAAYAATASAYADAASDAAYAAAYAAAAASASDAADTDTYKQQLLDFLKTFCNE